MEMVDRGMAVAMNDLLSDSLARIPPAQTEEYLRRILLRLFELGADSYVRLAARGEPPNYRVEMVMDEKTGQAGLFGEFSGKTHRELTAKQAAAAVWLEVIVDRPTVQAMIGSLRTERRKLRTQKGPGPAEARPG